MRLPVLLLLSALVVLGHWLLLAPGAATLARLAAPEKMAASPPEPSPPRAMQTRRLDSGLPAGSVAAPKPAIPGQAPALRQRPALAATASTSNTGQLAKKPGDGPVEKEIASRADPTPAASTLTATAQPADKPPSASAPADVNTPSAFSPTPAAPEPAAAADALAPWRLPQPARLKYEIQGQSRGLNYQASGVLDWEQDGSRYNARMVASVFFLGSRTLSSQGEITSDGLAPTRFADRTRSEQAAHFQADKGKITFSSNTPEAPWQPGAQDRLSVFFQLAGMLSGQPERFTAGTRVPVYTASARAADTWAFQVDGRETLKLPVGETPAIKLTRQDLRENDQRVEVWFAPTLSYWPVRIKLTQRNGDFVDQQLASVAKP